MTQPQRIIRAITFPLHGVADADAADRKEFDSALLEMWSLTTQAANYMLRELYVRDCRREPGMKKLPKMQHQYLYPEARALYPDLTPQSVSSLERAITRKYRACRWKILWTGGMSLPSMRYPTPLPIHNQSWRPLLEHEQYPAVSVRMRDRRWTLQLKGGSRYRRQLVAFRQLLSGEATAGELAIYRRADRRVMVKIVAKWPVPEPAHGDALIVRTAKDRLLVATNIRDDRIWNYNADQIPRWIAAHTRRLHRLSEDQKFETRPVPSFARRRKDEVLKYNHRMHSAVMEIAAQTVGYARRRRFGSLAWNDSCREFAPGFRWHDLRERVKTLCMEAGIVFVDASGEAASESPEPLAQGRRN